MLVAAKRAGFPVDEYRRCIDAGDKWCYACRAWHPNDAFSKDRSRFDGLSSACRVCVSEKSRSRYVPKPKRVLRGRRFVAARDDDVAQARGRVNHLVRIGVIPAPHQLLCYDCGHPWSPGGSRHEYDHHLGYAAEHHEHVQAVCSRCHAQREAGRGNRDRARNSIGQFTHGSDNGE